MKVYVVMWIGSAYGHRRVLGVAASKDAAKIIANQDAEHELVFRSVSNGGGVAYDKDNTYHLIPFTLFEG